MREQGCTEEELFSFLSRKRLEDSDHHYILSSMCTIPHPVAVKAHQMFIETNLGDPGLFKGTAEIEHLLIARFGSLLNNPGACGYATSGGTESNIQALRMARALFPGKKANVVLPESAHFSFQKACDILGLETRPIPLDDHYRMDIGRVEAAIDDETCCLVGIAGTTEYGMVDPISELSDLATEHSLHLHVDAAFGGLVLPFLEKAPKFDFSLPGVSSIAVDPHKMGMSTIPAGCLIIRDSSMLCALSIDTPYLSVKQEFTLSGTRPGAPVVAAFAVLEYLGVRGMRKVVQGCMKNTWRLIEGMETFGYRRAVTPEVNVATFIAKSVPSRWHISWTRKGHIRIICMPHVHRDIIEEFLKEIGESDA